MELTFSFVQGTILKTHTSLADICAGTGVSVLLYDACTQQLCLSDACMQNLCTQL